MEAHKLSEVNQYIKEVIALNFEDSIWVIAEISQIKSTGKHVYLELIEKDEESGEIIATVSGVIWMRSKLFIRNKYKDLADQILAQGNQIQCKVKVDFHPKYGLKFVLEDIDPSYTFGQLEIQRQETIENLKNSGLIAKNSQHTLPKVIQHIAIISSEKAAGYQDFIKQLENNSFGYQYRTKLFSSALQGNKLVQEMINCLSEIEANIVDFDCVVIIRGGGSKLDLSGFDDFNLAKRIALYPLPVLTGIGHEIDQNVIELVTHTPLKTPTAVANHILDHNLEFESSILELFSVISFKTSNLINRLQNSTDILFTGINYSASQYLRNIKVELNNKSEKTDYSARAALLKYQHEYAKIEQKIDLSNPYSILEKGYSLSYQNGKPINSVNDIEQHLTLDILYKDGKVNAKVNKVDKS